MSAAAAQLPPIPEDTEPNANADRKSSGKKGNVTGAPRPSLARASAQNRAPLEDQAAGKQTRSTANTRGSVGKKSKGATMSVILPVAVLCIFGAAVILWLKFRSSSSTSSSAGDGARTETGEGRGTRRPDRGLGRNSNGSRHRPVVGLSPSTAQAIKSVTNVLNP